MAKHVLSGLVGSGKMELLLQIEDSRVVVEVAENEDPLQKIRTSKMVQQMGVLC